MSTIMNETSKNSTRNVRRVEAPRPLKTPVSNTNNYSSVLPRGYATCNVESVDELLVFMEIILEAISQNEYFATDSELTDSVINLCKHMKMFGSQLETSFEDQLDRACTVFRNAIIRGSLEYEALKCMLNVIESRKCLWKSQESPDNVFNAPRHVPETDLSALKNYVKTHSVDNNSERSNQKTSRSPNKNFVKDELVIRNADSGKVMGVKGRRLHMIEQLSDTVISFQRVKPTAKERLVQITGANEGNLASATRLIRETIRKNASPIRGLSRSDSSSSSVDSFLERSGYDEVENAENESSLLTNDESYTYKHKVMLRNCHLTVTGDDYTYVTVAKAVLDDYFSQLYKSVDVKNENLNCVVPNTREHPKKSTSSPLFGASCVPPPISSNVLKTYESLPTTLLPDKKFLPGSFDLKCAELSTSDCAEKMWPNSDSSTNYFVATEPLLPDELSVDDTVLDNSLSSTEAAPAEIIYTKEFMLECRSSDLSREKPKDWNHILSNFPAIVKTSDDPVIVDGHSSED